MNRDQEDTELDQPLPDQEESGDDPEAEPEADPAPPFVLGGNEGLGNQWMMVGDREVAETFGATILDGLRNRTTRWAVRFSGEGFDGTSADPLKTAALLRRVAMTSRWIANGLFPGHRQLPGFLIGEAAHSIVLQFALARDEESVTVRVPIGDDDTETRGAEEIADTRRIYPSVEGGRYLGTLLASVEDGDELVRRLQPVGRQAVLSYQGALKELIEYEAQVDLLVPSMELDGEEVLRLVETPPARSAEGLVILNRVPETITRTVEVEGLLYTQNSLKTEFGIELDQGDHVTGEYDLRVADKLGPAWNKRVWARIEEIGPKAEWMPRAGRVRRVLQDVAVLKKGESRAARGTASSAPSN